MCYTVVAITGIPSRRGVDFFLCHVLTSSFTHALCSAPVPKRPEFEDNTSESESESHHQYGICLHGRLIRIEWNLSLNINETKASVGLCVTGDVCTCVMCFTVY
jgi:hypothetical protein